MTAESDADRAPVSVPNNFELLGKTNPYLHNVFTLLGIDPDAGDRAFSSRCRTIDGLLGAGNEIVVHGQKLDKADVARAKTLTSNKVDYLAERLLAHTVHKIDPAAFKEFMESIEAIPFEQPADVLPLAVTNARFLIRLLPAPEEVEVVEARSITPDELEKSAAPSAAEEIVWDL